MASIVPHGDQFRAHVCVKGQRDSDIFPTWKKANSWAVQREEELLKLSALKGKRNTIIDNNYTLRKLFKKYAKEVSPSKEGARAEIVRLEFFQKSYKDLCAIKLIDLECEDIEQWINQRLNPDPSTNRQPVKTSTVNRDLNLIGHCLTKARKWRLIYHHPFENLERPKNPGHRNRRIEECEIKQICTALGYKDGMTPKLKIHFTALAWLLAIETCMRRGEICSLTESTIDFEKHIAHLPKTKNGSARDVPLSPRAIELIAMLPKRTNPNTPIFPVSSSSMEALFRKYKAKTSIVNLTFHDSRHEAITRLVDTGKYNVFEVAAVTGHKNINELLTYYNKSAEQIAKEMAEDSAKTTQSPLASIVNIADVGQVKGLEKLIKTILVEQSKLAA